jgi:hypothetical protein
VKRLPLIFLLLQGLFGAGLLAQTPQGSPDQLLSQGKFQEAFGLATTELNKTPSSFQLLYVAGAAACRLEKYDTGVEFLLEAIRAYPNGIRNDYREALEQCVVKKNAAAMEAKATLGPAQPDGIKPPPQFPAGRSFDWTTTESCDWSQESGYEHTDTVHVSIDLQVGGIARYARDGHWCGKPLVAQGTWTRIGNLVSIQLPMATGPVVLTAEVVKGTSLRITGGGLF